MTKTTQQTYNLVPYPSSPKRLTHPNHLATIATLFGMEPPPLENCRVLEIGCSDGGNLIPMAYSLPNGQFVGIDFSETQIAHGKQVIDELGLTNITLQHKDILDIPTDFGMFDYIVCYGVYSWVPQAVRQKIFTLCQQTLVPNGVAYISYNTYPGWHMRTIIRDMMQYRSQHFSDLDSKAMQAWAMLDFMADGVGMLRNRPDGYEAYYLLLERERQRLQHKPNFYILHEFLEENNAPCYFHEFIADAAQFKLQYLAEAEFSMMQPSLFPKPIVEALPQLTDNRIQLEQYMDFLRNRHFRQTLLCHVKASIDAPSASQLHNLYIASAAKPVSPQADVKSHAAQQFRNPVGTVVSMGDPLAKMAMYHLAEIYPKSMLFSELVMTIEHATGKSSPNLAQIMLKNFAVDIIELYRQPLSLEEG
ncbi:MAG: hypothetical protein B6242_05285 [Anaerolineaceae bacterium 4572_78]|nr:MAG: hypothetical protein B6242_05285 [Anaerolineaceae bacterium 4572_78]